MEFFLSLLATVGWFVVMIAVLVTVHEFGHYFVARRLGLYILQFSVGFGPALARWRWRETEFRVACIPLGGYVRMLESAQLEEPSARGSARGLPSQEEPSARGSARGLPSQEEPSATGSGKGFPSREEPSARGSARGFPSREEPPATESARGFPSLAELDEQTRAELKGRTFDGLDPWRRIAIALGGPFANLVLAFVAYWLILVIGATVLVPHVGKVRPDSPAAEAGLVGGEEILAIDGRKVASVTDVSLALGNRLGETGTIEILGRSRGTERTWSLPIESWHTGDDDPNPFRSLGLALDYPAQIGEVEEGSPAATAGLKSGDRVAYIDGSPAPLWDDFVAAVRDSPERTLMVTVEREGTTVDLRLTPERTAEGVGRVGVRALLPSRLVRQTPLAAIPDALADTWNNTAMTVGLVGKMLTLAVSHRNISGPITIADVAGDFARAGWEHYLGLLALLSISLGIINLLPIPVLDGGHVLYCAAEIVRRRPLSERAQALGTQVGIGLVVCLMLLAFYNDITRYIPG